MKTITLKYAGEISQPEYVPPGSRITSSGGGVIEWTPGNLIEAAQNPTWRPWARGAAPGYMDTLRGVTVRATAAGAMRIDIEESVNDPFISSAYFDGDIATMSQDKTGMVDPVTGRVIVGQQKIASSGIPMIIPSSGTFAANGALSGLTAFPAALGKCFMYFPAGAVYSGSVAGLYYAEMGATTTATVYNNRWLGGVPEFPKVPTPIVAAGPGAYTQDTNFDITLGSFVLPGGVLGPNGEMALYPNYGANNTAGTKAWSAKYANNTLIGKSNTTTTMDNTPVFMRNAGRLDAQVSTSYVGFSANGGALFLRAAVDSSIDQEVILTGKILTATDYIFLQGYSAFASF